MMRHADGTTKVLLVLLALAVGAVALYALTAIGSILAFLMLAMLLAFVLSPLVSRLEGMGLPRVWAALLVFLGFFGLLTLGVYLILPGVVDQVSALQELINLKKIRGGLRDVERSVQKPLAVLGIRNVHVTTKLEVWLGGLLDNVFGIASSIVGFVLLLIMMLISTYFLLKDGPTLKKSFIAFVPNRFFEMTLSILHKIEWSIGAYLRGILLDALVIGNVTTLVMWLLGVPNFVLIGLVAGCANVVPYLGPPTAALVASAISVVANDNFGQVPPILLAFTGIRIFDDALVQPLTISNSVRLHPVTIIFAILIGGQLYGLLGMLFAVPVVGVLKVISVEFSDAMTRYSGSQPSGSTS